LDFYANKTLDQVNVDAQGAVAAWAFVALGEFCDVNGKEGFQVGSSDYIISYVLAPVGAPYTQTCGSSNDPITGLPSYYSTIQSSSLLTGRNNFNTSCYIFPDDTNVMRNGRIVDKYTFKCDVRVDYTGLWSTNTTAINGCDDSNRKIGLLVNIAGAAFDVDVSVDANLNTRNVNAPDADSISFGAGKIKFAWDNYVTKTPNFDAVTGGTAKVTYGYLKSANGAYKGASIVEQVIFSFATPKSEGQNFFYWDPAISANANSGPSLVPYLGMVLTLLSVMLLF